MKKLLLIILIIVTSGCNLSKKKLDEAKISDTSSYILGYKFFQENNYDEANKYFGQLLHTNANPTII